MTKKIVRQDMFVHDMIHNNPGLAKYESDYLDPKFLKARGYDAKVFEIFDCAQFGLLWDKLDEVTGRKKVFPCNSLERSWVEQKKKEIRALYEEVKSEGLQVYFMMDIIVLPEAMKEIYPDILNEDGKIDILSPMMTTVFDCMFQEMFEEFPQIDGIYIRYGETYVGACYDTPYHCGNNPILGDGWEYHEFLINYLIQTVCEKYNKKIMYRTWGFGDFQYNKETYLTVSNQIPVHDNFYFCIKHTSGDFHRTYRFNQCLNVGKHKQVVEVQAAREYEGKGAYPDYIADGVINGFEEYKWCMTQEETTALKEVVNTPDSLIKGIWTWSRGGGWDGPYINGANGKNGSVVVEDGSELWDDLNAYVISHWAKDTSKSDRDYVLQYATEVLQMDKKDAHLFYDLCMLSQRAVLLGRACNTAEYNPDVFWTRDQNIQYSVIVKMIAETIENQTYDLLLYERHESVKTWENIVRLACEINDSVPMKEYIVTTCKYGYYLYSIYEQIFIGNVYGILGGNEEKVNAAVEKYDELWLGWEQLFQEAKGCPTLFEKKPDTLDLIGYNWNQGLDAAINPLRELDENGRLKETYLPSNLALNEWGLVCWSSDK